MIDTERRLDRIVRHAHALVAIHDTSSGVFLEALSQLEEALEEDPYLRCTCLAPVSGDGGKCAECRAGDAEVLRDVREDR